MPYTSSYTSNVRKRDKILYVCKFTTFVGIICSLFYVYSNVRTLQHIIEETGTTHGSSFDVEELILTPSEYCLSEIKAKINHQRGGWGSMTPGDLYRGAKETFDLSLLEAIPIKTPRRIPDIGCGFELYDTFLLKHYGYASLLVR